VPGLKTAEIDGRLEEAGIDMVFIVCVNDGAVMTAWKKDQGLAGSEMIEFVADTDADLTEALGLLLTGDGKPYGKTEGPNNALGYHTKRCKRSCMFVDNCVVKVLSIAEASDDPAGDARPESSCVEAMLENMSKL